jgi:hypothetical protein
MRAMHDERMTRDEEARIWRLAGSPSIHGFTDPETGRRYTASTNGCDWERAPNFNTPMGINDRWGYVGTHDLINRRMGPPANQVVTESGDSRSGLTPAAPPSCRSLSNPRCLSSRPRCVYDLRRKHSCHVES